MLPGGPLLTKIRGYWLIWFGTDSLKERGILEAGTGLTATDDPVNGRTVLSVTPVGGAVTGARVVATTAPLTGGGDLTADRTIAITPASSSAAGSMAAADKIKLDALTAANGGLPYTATLLTLDATPTALISFPLANNKVAGMRLRITGNDLAGALYYVFESGLNTALTTFGGALLSPGGSGGPNTNFPMGAGTFSASYAGGIVTLTITGIAGTNVTWAASVSLLVS